MRSLTKTALDSRSGHRARCSKAALLTSALLTFACGSGTKPAHSSEVKPAPVAWRLLGSWSGKGNAQTESFDIGFSQIRIRWETRNESSPGAGTFAVTVNSAVSGRDLVTAVDQRGAGHDTAYVGVDPHYSYLVINSKDLDWSITVEEPAPEPTGQNPGVPTPVERVYNYWPVPDRSELPGLHSTNLALLRPEEALFACLRR